MNVSSPRAAILTGAFLSPRSSSFPFCAVLLSVLLLTACKAPVYVAGKNCRPIPEMPGPEDFDIDPAAKPPRIFVSSQDRRDLDPNGEFVRQGRIFQLSVSRDTAPVPQPLPFADRDGLPFHPHGIAYAVLGGVPYLYVINHAMRRNHLIEVFAVKPTELKLIRRLRSPLLTSPNDLTVLPNGNIYVTNDHGTTSGFTRFLEDLFARPWGNVVMFEASTNSWRIAAEKFAFPNGVAASPSGSRLYVASTRDRAVFTLPIAPNGDLGSSQTLISLPAGPDNLLWEKPGILNVAAHTSVTAFYSHMQNRERPSPSEVFRIDVEKASADRIYSNDGSQISASSTALVTSGSLLIGQVFEPFLLNCQME